MVDLKMDVMIGEVDGYDQSFKEEYKILDYKINPTEDGYGVMIISFDNEENKKRFQEDFDIE